MAITKVMDLINPEVLADTISASLESGIKFAPHAKVDTTLVGEAGDTITRPKYAYIGAAKDLEEGVAIDPSLMSMTTTKVTIKEVGNAVAPTSKAILTNVDGTLSEAAKQLALSVSDKIEIDYVEALDEAILGYDGAPTSISNIIDALSVFNDEDDEDYILFINPSDYTELRKEAISGNTFLTREQLADLLGLKDIVRTKRVEVGTAYIQKDEAVEIVYKKTPEINTGYDELKRVVNIVIDTLYAVNLYNDKGVVKIVEGFEVPGEGNGNGNGDDDETPDVTPPEG